MGDPAKEETARCLGFGEREGVCENEAGTPWTPLWCDECDEARRGALSESFAKISAGFEVSGG